MFDDDMPPDPFDDDTSDAIDGCALALVLGCLIWAALFAWWTQR